MIVAFTVDGTPVPCERPRVTRNGRHTFTPKRTRDYEKLVRAAAQRAVADGDWRVHDGDKYCVEVSVYPAANRGDAENFLKGILDAMKGVIWEDDRHVLEAHVYMFVDR